jgi:hypothetical protein
MDREEALRGFKTSPIWTDASLPSGSRSDPCDGITSPQGRPSYYAQSERVAFQSNPEILVPPPDTMIWIAPYIDRPWETNIDVINHFDSTEGSVFTSPLGSFTR